MKYAALILLVLHATPAHADDGGIVGSIAGALATAMDVSGDSDGD